MIDIELRERALVRMIVNLSVLAWQDKIVSAAEVSRVLSATLLLNDTHNKARFD